MLFWHNHIVESTTDNHTLYSEIPFTRKRGKLIMTTAKKVLTIAASQLGISESPAGTNRVKYNEWYGVNGIPWCATFVSWVLDKAGLTELRGLQNECGSAFCPYIEKYYRQQGRWQGIPPVGAIVLFDWGGDGVSDHIGFVELMISKGGNFH